MTEENFDTKEGTGSFSPEIVKSVSETNPIKKRKKIFWIGVGIGIVLLGLLLSNFFGLTGLNIFSFFAPTQPIYKVNYVLMLSNGTVIDEGNSTFSSGFSKIIGINKDLDKEIMSMHVGETKKFELSPAEAFGEHNEELVFYVPRIEKESRYMEMNRTQNISIDTFKNTFEEIPLEGKTYSFAGTKFKFFVVKVYDDVVELRKEIGVGEELSAGMGFVLKVVEINEEKIKLRLEGERITMPFGSGNYEFWVEGDWFYKKWNPVVGEEIERRMAEFLGLDFEKAKVLDFNDSIVKIDANPKYAGESILLNVTLLEVSQQKITGKAIIEGAPTMQVFIMSYCPFGLQMLKGLLPVWKEFDDKANIELRFVHYVMHGKKEEEENYRMICLREEQYDKFIPYLKCFVGSGNAEECLKKVGADINKVNECMKNRASRYFEEDKKLNEKYGVSGSPTVIIDGQEVRIWPRSPEMIKEKLCEAFAIKPKECNMNFSEENPSPGFGYSTSSSSSGGTCS